MIKSRPDKQLEFRPFWFSALNYFLLLFGIAVLLSSASWLAFHQFDEEVSLIILISVFLTVITVGLFIRSRLKHRTQTKILIENNKVNERIRIRKKEGVEPKLTVAANNNLVLQIEKKSEAANLLKTISKGHLEVFESCNSYLELIDNELARVGAGSPRLSGFIKSRERIRTLHKSHLMKWVETESTELFSITNRVNDFKERIEIGKKTLKVLESALEFYPNERTLCESHSAVSEFVCSSLIAELIESAEGRVRLGDYQLAIQIYRDAIREIEINQTFIHEKDAILSRINGELSRLTKVEK